MDRLTFFGNPFDERYNDTRSAMEEWILRMLRAGRTVEIIPYEPEQRPWNRSDRKETCSN